MKFIGVASRSIMDSIRYWNITDITH